ncbi:MAG TPA: hypothetical protein PK370_02930 [Candidatus Woesebacteria bacterium]|nr:hypothetical protein [Candidatus Woesebacteria bacterium]HPJ17261.1 hypothetical protein [Candidatus Woesebacteria bacterium]
MNDQEKKPTVKKISGDLNDFRREMEKTSLMSFRENVINVVDVWKKKGVDFLDGDGSEEKPSISEILARTRNLVGINTEKKEAEEIINCIDSIELTVRTISGLLGFRESMFEMGGVDRETLEKIEDITARIGMANVRSNAIPVKYKLVLLLISNIKPSLVTSLENYQQQIVQRQKEFSAQSVFASNNICSSAIKFGEQKAENRFTNNESIFE